MGEGNLFIDVSPRIVRANHPAKIVLRPLYEHARFLSDKTYEVSIFPRDYPGVEDQAMQPVNGCLEVDYTFGGEGEYKILVHLQPGERRRQLVDVRVYALEEDLFSRYPYKGDFHMHSYRSDGWESPAYVAAACRKIGMDVAGITDHRQYAPSLEAIQAFDGVETDLRLYPGEEVHLPNSPVHIVNFGGSFSVNELIEDDACYRSEVTAIQQGLGDLLDRSASRQYASCLWCYEKIRQAGGMSIFCHPYWITQEQFNAPEMLIDLHFRDLRFDAFEVIGGNPKPEAEANQLQAARYEEERARGRRIPIVGVSDSHGTENGLLFGWYYTIFFAKTADLPEVIGSIRDLFSVAVEAMPGETPHLHGPFRLVKYACFLMREVFPLHDVFCQEEGRLMLAHLAGDGQAAGKLRGVKGQVARLYRRLWGMD